MLGEDCKVKSTRCTGGVRSGGDTADDDDEGAGVRPWEGAAPEGGLSVVVDDASQRRRPVDDDDDR